MGSITSEEVNYLVYRYLQESGFVHSAFTFAYESLISKSMVSQHGADVPPGALVAFLQKGLQLVTMEHHLNHDGSERVCDEDMSLLTPHVCQALAHKSLVRKGDFAHVGKGLGKADEFSEMEEDPVDKDRSGPESAHSKGRSGSGNQRLGGGSDVPVLKGDVTVLRSHTAEVFCCAWNPCYNVLATGSGDATARIWDMDRPGAPGSETSVELSHRNDEDEAADAAAAAAAAAVGTDKMENERDVTTLEWRRDGSMLATGGMDGVARIWSKDGVLHHTLTAHRESIFSLHFNEPGELLLTGSYDNSTIAWDVATGEQRRRFEVHTAQVLDVDWKDVNTFASCSTDRSIKVCTLNNEEQPVLQTFLGHKDEVNTVKWDPSGSILASCSDDTTAKLWALGQPKYLHDLCEHGQEIYTIRWSPTGAGSPNPNKKLMLASASFDSMVKLWDVETGCCVHSLNRHDKKVYTVAFSPSGDFIASGSLGGQLYVWSTKDGSIVRSYKGGSDIFEVAWNSAGDRIAACGGVSGASNAVTVIDFRM